MAIVAVPLAAIILAIVAALFVYAWFKIVYYIALALTPQLPGIFHYASDFVGWLSGKALDAINSAYNQMIGWAESSMSPLVDLIQASIGGSEALWGAVRDFAYGTGLTIKHIITYTIPNAITQGISEAEQAIVPQVQEIAANARDQAINWAQSEANTVWNNTVQFVGGQVNELHGIINATTQAMSSTLNMIENEIGQVIGRVDNLEHALGAAEAALEGELNALEGGLTSGLDGLRQQMGGAIQSLEQSTNARVTPLEGAVAIALPAAIAAVATTVDDYIRDCGKPLCDTLGPLTNLIPALADLFSLGLFTAWIAYCVHDPEDAARDTVTVAGPIADSVGSAVQAVV